jgi:hypothetical protein
MTFIISPCRMKPAASHNVEWSMLSEQRFETNLARDPRSPLSLQATWLDAHRRTLQNAPA